MMWAWRAAGWLPGPGGVARARQIDFTPRGTKFAQAFPANAWRRAKTSGAAEGHIFQGTFSAFDWQLRSS
eukprot:scaffold8586_cov239-Pinguiococcus_pyrenoidosus.AAC.3